MEGTLERAHCILLFIGDRDDSTTSRHLEDIVSMVSYNHELGQGQISEDGIVRQANVGDVEVDELGAVVVACPEGDREADLPNRDRGAIGDFGERLGWLKLVVGHLEIVECFHGQGVEPCPAIDEGPGDHHVADDWGTKNREDSGCSRTLEQIGRAHV